MHSFTLAIINGSYLIQLQSSHHQAVYVRNINGKFIAIVYIRLKIISGKLLRLTNKGI